MFLRNWYNQFFSGKLKYQEFYKKLAHFSKYGMNIGSPISVDTSGESFLLQQLSTEYKSKNEFIFFDIGANKGEYTDCVLSKFNNCQLSCYLFEPQKKLFNALLDKYKNDSRLNIFPYGLGSNVEEVNLYTFNDINTLSSLYATFKGEVQATGVERISVIRLDQFLNENAISHISYIKIDVEGHELEVLKGMGKYLSNGSIQRIQFEFGSFNVSSRTFFKDFWDLLAPHYHLYRIVKDGIYPINQYGLYLEVFDTTNYLAVLKKN